MSVIVSLVEFVFGEQVEGWFVLKSFVASVFGVNAINVAFAEPSSLSDISDKLLVSRHDRSSAIFRGRS